MVHTCPRCELRFRTEVELTGHLRDDHGVDVEGFERYRYRPAGPPPGGEGDGARRYLVVANRTLHGDELVVRLRHLAEAGPARFSIVVPDDGADPALAASRLRHLVDLLAREGIEADGEVGHADPFHAVAERLHHGPGDIDEIVVSTLPAAFSRWLAADLPQRLERHFGIPVSRVEAAAVSRGR